MTWKYVIWRASPLFLIIMLVSYFAGNGWSAIPSALVAWGTILLAFATFQLVQTVTKQEKQRRGDEQAREKRDRKDRLLNEIIEWAEDILKCRPTLDITNRINLEALPSQQMLEMFLVDSTRWGFNAIKAEGIYIRRIASRFKRDLQDAVDVVSEKLVSQTKLLEQIPGGKSTLSDAAKNRELLNESAIDLMDKAVNLLFNNSQSPS